MRIARKSGIFLQVPYVMCVVRFDADAAVGHTHAHTHARPADDNDGRSDTTPTNTFSIPAKNVPEMTYFNVECMER